jgi:hypothetical protein
LLSPVFASVLFRVFVLMRTGPETPAKTHYMFRGLVRGFEGFTQVIIARPIEVSMCRRGPARLYSGHEVRTTKEPKESYYNLETWAGWKRINKPCGLYLILLATAQGLFGLD